MFGSIPPLVDSPCASRVGLQPTPFAFVNFSFINTFPCTQSDCSEFTILFILDPPSTYSNYFSSPIDHLSTLPLSNESGNFALHSSFFCVYSIDGCGVKGINWWGSSFVVLFQVVFGLALSCLVLKDYLGVKAGGFWIFVQTRLPAEEQFRW